jgi:hypothetical protein
VPSQFVPPPGLDPRAFVALAGAFLFGGAAGLYYLIKLGKSILPSAQVVKAMPALADKSLGDQLADVVHGVRRLESAHDDVARTLNERNAFIDRKFLMFETNFGSVFRALQDANRSRDSQTKIIEAVGENVDALKGDLSTLSDRLGKIEKFCPGVKHGDPAADAH